MQYVRDQLVKLYGAGHEKLNFISNGNTLNLADTQFETLKDRSDHDVAQMDNWISYYRTHFGVYFSSPLDLDLAMLEAFPSVYKGLAPAGGGPRLPAPGSPTYQGVVKQRMKQVLASDATTAPATLGDSYTQEQVESFAWYKYLFIDGSKPVMHMRALLAISNETLLTEAPVVLKQLIAGAKVLLTQQESVE